jgi:hypothetical protein
MLYDSGSGEYFFIWIEHKTKALGAIFTYGGNVYPNAVSNISLFKQLLRNAVNNSIPVSKKIDDVWEKIKGFGGDKLIAKKIIFCYYSNDYLPIFKTEHLELFCTKLEIQYEDLSLEKYGVIYSELTVGQKFELLNGLLLNEWKTYLPTIDKNAYCAYLYESNEYRTASKSIKRDGTIPLNKIGLLYSPKYEQEVLYLFAKLHRDIGFPYINTIQVAFPDIVAQDNNRNTVRIELEVLSSDFILHKHDKNECEYIVCWENDIVSEDLVNFPEIIPLKDYLEEYSIK